MSDHTVSDDTDPNAGPAHRPDGKSVTRVTDELEVAYTLVDRLQVPVVVCPPNLRWAPGRKELDVKPPWGWAVMTAEECRPLLAAFRPGVDTLAAVTGHGLDAVDVDTKAPMCGS